MQAGGLTDYLTSASGMHSSRGPNSLQPMAGNRNNIPGTGVIQKGKMQ